MCRPIKAVWIVQDLVPLGVGPSLATVVLNRTDSRQTVKGNLENINGVNGPMRRVRSTGLWRTGPVSGCQVNPSKQSPVL